MLRRYFIIRFRAKKRAGSLPGSTWKAGRRKDFMPLITDGGPVPPWTSGRDPPTPENAAHVAHLPRISDAACMVPRRGDQGKPARSLSSAQLLSRERPAARGKPEEEERAAAVGGAASFGPLTPGLTYVKVLQLGSFAQSAKLSSKCV